MRVQRRETRPSRSSRLDEASTSAYLEWLRPVRFMLVRRTLDRRTAEAKGAFAWLKLHAQPAE